MAFPLLNKLFLVLPSYLRIGKVAEVSARKCKSSLRILTLPHHLVCEHCLSSFQFAPSTSYVVKFLMSLLLVLDSESGVIG